MKIPLFFKTYNSLFKSLKCKWYFGKIAIGTPLFFPRNWRKVTTDEAIIRATESINNSVLIKKSFEEWVEYHKQYPIATPKKIGFDFRDIMWKTKYNLYRFEYNPVLSFVFFWLSNSD